MTPEQQRVWVQQWRRATVALQQQKLAELMAMTASEALQAADRLLELASTAHRDPQALASSGLVEQQRIFHKKQRV